MPVFQSLLACIIVSSAAGFQLSGYGEDAAPEPEAAAEAAAPEPEPAEAAPPASTEPTKGDLGKTLPILGAVVILIVFVNEVLPGLSSS